MDTLIHSQCISDARTRISEECFSYLFVEEVTTRANFSSLHKMSVITDVERSGTDN